MPNTAQNVVISTKSLDMPAELLVPHAGQITTNNNSGNNSGEVVAASPTNTGKSPALIVLHDWYGLDDATPHAAMRLSESGYVTLIPDLFARSGGPKDTSSETALLNFTLTLSDSLLIGDTLAALDWLTHQDTVDTSRIGIVGWGWGGAYALMAAAHDPRLRVAVDIGGHITYPVLTAQKPGSPLNFVANLEGPLFAAFPGNDPLFPEGEVGRLSARMREHDKVGEVKIYPAAPPRFWRDESLPQTAQLWRRLENFLQQNLIASDTSEEPIGDYGNEESRLHA